MSEREQATALKLLSDFMKATTGIVDSKALEDVRERAKKFLHLPADPESHGQRRG